MQQMYYKNSYKINKFKKIKLYERKVIEIMKKKIWLEKYKTFIINNNEILLLKKSCYDV